MLAPPQNCVVFDTDPLQHCQDQDARRCSANRYRRRRLHHPQLPSWTRGRGPRATQRRRGAGSGERLVPCISWDFIVSEGYRIILGWTIYRSFMQDRVILTGALREKVLGMYLESGFKELAAQKF